MLLRPLGYAIIQRPQRFIQRRVLAFALEDQPAFIQRTDEQRVSSVWPISIQPPPSTQSAIFGYLSANSSGWFGCLLFLAWGTI